MSLSSDEQHCERPLLVCVQYADDATTCAQGYFHCVVKTKQYISGVGQFLFIPISKKSYLCNYFHFTDYFWYIWCITNDIAFLRNTVCLNICPLLNPCQTLFIQWCNSVQYDFRVIVTCCYEHRCCYWVCRILLFNPVKI